MTTETTLKKTYGEAKEFFGISIPSVKLFLVNRIVKIKDIKQDWNEAGFFHDNNVIVVDRELLPKIGYQKNEFDGIVMHELSHIFLKKLIKRNIPIWIEEGLCSYLSFPAIKPEKISELCQLNTLEDWNKQDTPFTYCAYFFHMLQKWYGRDQIRRFITALKKQDVEKSFQGVFGRSLISFENEYKELIENEKTS